MKLELKHLAPYFPYDLDYWSIDDECVNTLMKISHNGYGNLLINNEHHEDRIKPYLYPLSDLTKEIEHNGEKFVPIQKIDQLFSVEIDLNFDVETYSYVESGLGSYNILDCYAIVATLLKWHFDVFGLIPNGLAIDINTIE